MNRKLLSSVVILMLAAGVASLYVHKVSAQGLKGDINGDGKVDAADITVVLDAFGSYAGHPRWNPNADISGPDGKSDNVVDMNDLILVLMEFGQSVP